MALLLGRQRRRRLVEDDDLGLVVDGAGDLDHLALGGAERRDDGGGVDGEVERLQKLLGGDVDAAQAVQRFLLAEIDVLGDRHRGDEARLLEDHGDAVRERLVGRAVAHLLGPR